VGDDLFRFGGDFVREEFIHGEDGVRGGEVVARTAEDEDGGNAILLKEGAHALDEGGDGFLVVGDELGHARVPDEKVGG